MPNMSLKKVAMPEQEPLVRARNFEEVTLGYTEAQAIEEAQRCLDCKHKPCIKGCPVKVQIPKFVTHIAKGEFQAAYDALYADNALPAVCGRVCPQETQCEQLCVRGIKGEPVAIGRLERFAADWAMTQPKKEQAPPTKNGKKVAVVGSGPAGLTCAGELARLGYEVMVYEAFHVCGGVLMYGIPEFRLPKAIVQQEVQALCALGVQFTTNAVVGQTFTVDELFEMGYGAVFIGSGAGLPSFMNIPGENLLGVYSANEYLTRINLMKAYESGYETPIHQSRSVAVVGGGNVAMDAARSALRLGAEKVSIVYRRSEAELPARLEEVHHAKAEGIDFHLLCNPTEVLGDENGYVNGLRCIRMALGEPDDSGRRRPIAVPDSDFTLDVDCVIMSIGTSPNPLIRRTTPGLDTNRWGCIVADEASGQTSREGVFAGGDAVTGAATVILAMGAGKDAAAAMHDFLQQA